MIFSMQSSGSEFEIPAEAERAGQPSVEAVPVKSVVESQANPEASRPTESVHLNPEPISAQVASVSVPAQQVMPAASADLTVQTPEMASATADDVDLIEKTWIERAKSIIAKTKDDPYLQKSEISKVKAEYIEKRYNKKIKLADDTVKK